MKDRTPRVRGSIYTPPEIAEFLTSWAIQDPMDKVLDVGVGEGIFVFAAYDRLRQLGAHTADAQSQLYGSEIDLPTYDRFLRKAHELHIGFPNVCIGDFFDADLPSVDVLVGNPPYVRRTYIENVDRIRQSVASSNQAIDEADLSRLTDLSVYFLMRALPALESEGKLAVVTTDSWLNANYGKVFKEYLLQNFEIQYLISLDRRIFNDAQVKPVLVLATKRITRNGYTHFVRVKNGLPIRAVQRSLAQLDAGNDDISQFRTKGSELKADKPWGMHFKAPNLYAELASNPLMTPIASLANTRIGIQTLAKDFFVLTAEQAELAQIEEEYLEPLAQSPRYFGEPTIQRGMKPPFYMFYCSESKEDLQGTRALEYILEGESTEVVVRGKGTTVLGYQNKKRIQKASREPWYNLRTSLKRRGRAAILIPRLAYRTFTVIWNKADFVPGELFIEFLPLPLDSNRISIEVYLAALTSSVSEIMLRVHAQVYGGGTYNIKPGQIKRVPILNVALLAVEQKEQLKQAYLYYLGDEGHDRTAIDDVVCQILGFGQDRQQRIREVLQDLHQIATESKKAT